MQHRRHHQQLVLVALAVVLFAGLSSVVAAPWALTAGEAACPTLPYCTASFDACTAYAPGSYFMGADSPPFVNATSPQRQLAAAPFRFDGEGSFEVQGLSMIFSRKASDNAVFNLTVLFYEANATNASLPGDVLPGWEGGRAVQVSKSTPVSTGPSGTVVFYNVAGAITPSFNLSAGTYFLSVASFGSKPSSTTDGSYRIAGSNTTGTYFAAYLGIQPRGTVFPALAVNATNAWTIPNNADNVLACVWPTGTVHRPQGGNTTNTTTTTGGNTTTTGGNTTTTTGGNTTTTGGSGGGSNPTDYLVRYPLATDLNSLSPAGFISGVTATLQLPPDAQIEIVAARRAQVTTTSSNKRASVAAQQQQQGTLLDFFVSGADGASFMEKALSAKLADLRANNVSIASAPTTVAADASSGALLRPAAFVSLVVDYLRLPFSSTSW